MTEMSIADYEAYLDGGLLFVDHHDVLRAEPGGFPLAVNAKQVEALISYLQSIKSRVGS